MSAAGRPTFNVVDRAVRRMRARPVRRRIPEHSVVLDIGCGTENWLVRSVDRCAPGSLGVDPHLPDALVGPSGVKGVVAELLPSRADSFDVVTSLAVIEHLEPDQRDEMLAAAWQLLRRRGRLVLTTPSPRAKPVLEFLAYRLRVISAHEIRDHKTYYSVNDLVALLRGRGFVVEATRTFQFGLNQLVVARRPAEDLI